MLVTLTSAWRQLRTKIGGWRNHARDWVVGDCGMGMQDHLLARQVCEGRGREGSLTWRDYIIRNLLLKLLF